jgi:hypothetical protein
VVSLWLADYYQEVLGGLAGPAGTGVAERVAVGEGPIGGLCHPDAPWWSRATSCGSTHR